MKFSNDPIDAVRIIQMFIPVLTFFMGYFLTDMNHRREMKRVILKEKFEKLYHPVYLMVLDVSYDDVKIGFVTISGDEFVKKVFAFLLRNIYLASTKAQNDYGYALETYNKITRQKDTGGEEDPETRKQFDDQFGNFLNLILNEYKETALKLGYEFEGDFKTHSTP